MGIQANAYRTINPFFIEPEILLEYNQASGFTDLLADGQLRVRLAEDDLLVYMKQLNIHTKMSSGMYGANELPGVDIMATMISTPTYQFRTRVGYDRQDTTAGGRWNFSVPEAYRLGMRQANFQLARTAALFGINPQNGEGFVNAANAVNTNLPPDSNGNTTVQQYDNGQMAFYLAQVILGIKTRTLQLGIGKEFTIIGPQRTLGLFEYNVVQLTQFQRVGAGTASTAETLKDIVQANGDKVLWDYDDTLQGAGTGGADIVIVAMPKVSKPAGQKVNTNVFATLTPGSEVCLTQYCDMAAPRETISPMAGGATDVLTDWRVSPGWAPRGVALTVINMPY